MRIISSFRDFYDSVMKSGMDKQVIYVRESSGIVINSSLAIGKSENQHYSASSRYLGFCGHIYKLYIINGPDGFKKIYYDFEEFKENALALGAAKKYDFGNRWWRSSFDNFKDENTSSLLDIFHKYQVPIFTVSYNKTKGKRDLILNPKLDLYDFQTIKDSYTAYQDIFQYVAGVLNKQENKMVKVSDAIKLHKHGFDKWSFRQKGPKK